jgi:ribose-phosphate pyrophosphokinase
VKVQGFDFFSGTSNPGLAREIAAYLGVPDGPRIVKRFADGELYVQIQESIRGCDVFLIQPTCAPVNDHLMELLIMVDACRRASARQITAVVPYYGYARADRKTAGRESITAKLTANLLVTSGVDRVLAMDLHSAQIQGYFDIPCDHIYGSPVLVDYLSTQNLGDIVVVSPDVGGVARARAFAKQMNDAPLAIIDKRRTGHNQAESLTVIGDVAGKTACFDRRHDRYGRHDLCWSEAASSTRCATGDRLCHPRCFFTTSLRTSICRRSF